MKLVSNYVVIIFNFLQAVQNHRHGAFQTGGSGCPVQVKNLLWHTSVLGTRSPQEQGTRGRQVWAKMPLCSLHSFFSTHACCKSRHEINCVIDPTWKLQLRPRSRQLVTRCHSLRHDLGHASLQPGTQRQGFDATGKNSLTLFFSKSTTLNHHVCYRQIDLNPIVELSLL